MGGARALPPGQTVADVAAGLSFIMSRHQALRTRLRFGPDGQTQQVVHASGDDHARGRGRGRRRPGRDSGRRRRRVQGPGYSTTSTNGRCGWP